MEPNSDPLIPLLIFLAVIAFFIYRIVTKGGWKGAMFGAAIKRSYGTIEQESNAFSGGRFRVHLLDSTPPQIGIEVVSTSWLSWQMTPVKLSKESARELIDALSSAIAEA